MATSGTPAQQGGPGEVKHNAYADELATSTTPLAGKLVWILPIEMVNDSVVKDHPQFPKMAFNHPAVILSQHHDVERRVYIATLTSFGNRRISDALPNPVLHDWYLPISPADYHDKKKVLRIRDNLLLEKDSYVHIFKIHRVSLDIFRANYGQRPGGLYLDTESYDILVKWSRFETVTATAQPPPPSSPSPAQVPKAAAKKLTRSASAQNPTVAAQSAPVPAIHTTRKSESDHPPLEGRKRKQPAHLRRQTSTSGNQVQASGSASQALTPLSQAFTSVPRASGSGPQASTSAQQQASTSAQQQTEPPSTPDRPMSARLLAGINEPMYGRTPYPRPDERNSSDSPFMPLSQGSNHHGQQAQVWTWAWPRGITRRCKDAICMAAFIVVLGLVVWWMWTFSSDKDEVFGGW